MDLVSRKRSDSSQDQDQHGCLGGGYDAEFAGKSIGEKGEWDFE